MKCQMKFPGIDAWIVEKKHFRINRVGKIEEIR
jgi:hypothetical protein